MQNKYIWHCPSEKCRQLETTIKNINNQFDLCDTITTLSKKNYKDGWVDKARIISEKKLIKILNNKNAK